MKSNKFLTIILILILAGVVIILVPRGKGNNPLTNPFGNFVSRPTPSPEVANYNPPKEVKYDSSTDLKKELESVSPKVYNSDFDSFTGL